MTPKEAKEIIIKERDSLKANPIVKVEDCLYEALEIAIKALGQQPCEDCISRAEAFHILECNKNVYVEDIEELPSVTPELIKGRWIEVIDDTDSSGRKKNWHYKCSICGNEDSGLGEYNYCPICGAEMSESEE